MTDTATVTRWYVDAYQSGTDNHLTMESENRPDGSRLLWWLAELWAGEDVRAHALRIQHQPDFDRMVITHHRLGVIVNIYQRQVAPPYTGEPMF